MVKCSELSPSHELFVTFHPPDCYLPVTLTLLSCVLVCTRPAFSQGSLCIVLISRPLHVAGCDWLLS